MSQQRMRLVIDGKLIACDLSDDQLQVALSNYGIDTSGMDCWSMLIALYGEEKRRGASVTVRRCQRMADYLETK